MKAGLPLVEVTFRVDANGILSVSALEKRSQTDASIEVILSMDSPSKRSMTCWKHLMSMRLKTLTLVS